MISLSLSLCRSVSISNVYCGYRLHRQVCVEGSRGVCWKCVKEHVCGCMVEMCTSYVCMHCVYSERGEMRTPLCLCPGTLQRGVTQLGHLFQSPWPGVAHSPPCIYLSLCVVASFPTSSLKITFPDTLAIQMLNWSVLAALISVCDKEICASPIRQAPTLCLVIPIDLHTL